MRKKLLITGGSGFIGTNLIDLCSEKYDIYNIDKSPPRNINQFRYWTCGDLTDRSKIQSLIHKINPNTIIHLAARTDLSGVTIDDYTANTNGTENLIAAIDSTTNCEKIIFASSKFIVPNGYVQKHIYDYCPNTIYGESKARMEQIIRASSIKQTWCILRPTSIWGEWFDQPYKEFFNRVLDGKYVNFTGNMAKKTFGYVGNTVFQIKSILEANNKLIHRKIFYLGDYEKITVNEWAEKIAMHNNTRILNFPISALKIMGITGDMLNSVGIKFPITSFRVQNMTTECVNELTSTQRLAPNLPYSIDEGIYMTIKWLK